MYIIYALTVTCSIKNVNICSTMTGRFINMFVINAHPFDHVADIYISVAYTRRKIYIAIYIYLYNTVNI